LHPVTGKTDVTAGITKPYSKQTSTKFVSNLHMLSSGRSFIPTGSTLQIATQ